MSRSGTIADIDLDSVDGWTNDFVARMSEVGITTVEQVVALGATDGGVRAISEQLQVELAKAKELLDAARARLPAALRDELDRPADTSDFGLGVLPPPTGDND